MGPCARSVPRIWPNPAGLAGKGVSAPLLAYTRTGHWLGRGSEGTFLSPGVEQAGPQLLGPDKAERGLRWGLGALESLVEPRGTPPASCLRLSASRLPCLLCGGQARLL